MTTFFWPIIKKARDYYYSGDVLVEKITPMKTIFIVDGARVTFEKMMKYMKIRCECDFCSQHSVKVEREINGLKERITMYPGLCSRKLACLWYLYGKKGKIKIE